jgi:hypothetical protein
MYLFLFFALPLFYYIFATLKSSLVQKDEIENIDEAQTKKAKFSKAFMIFIGLVLGVIYALVDFFTAFAYRNPTYNIGTNFTYYFLSTTLMPVIICAVILFLLSKDNWQFKFQNFTPLILGFFVLFLPYETISKNDTFDFFLLFIVPVLYTTMIILMDYNFEFIQAIYEKSVKAKHLYIPILGILLALIIPSLIYSMYYTQMLVPLAIILGIIFVGGTITLEIFSKQIQSKLK